LGEWWFVGILAADVVMFFLLVTIVPQIGDPGPDPCIWASAPAPPLIWTSLFFLCPAVLALFPVGMHLTQRIFACVLSVALVPVAFIAIYAAWTTRC
jgi:hypothetical protein